MSEIDNGGGSMPKLVYVTVCAFSEILIKNTNAPILYTGVFFFLRNSLFTLPISNVIYYVRGKLYEL